MYAEMGTSVVIPYAKNLAEGARGGILHNAAAQGAARALLYVGDDKQAPCQSA
mgnify:CR=1 FL=1